MKNYVDAVICHLKASNVKDMLELHVKNNVALKDVHDTALRLTAKLKLGKAKLSARLKIEKFTMVSKLLDARKWAKITQKNLEKAKVELSKHVREGTLVRKLFMEIVKRESEEAWTVEKEKSKNKFENNKRRQKVISEAKKLLKVLESVIMS